MENQREVTEEFFTCNVCHQNFPMDDRYNVKNNKKNIVVYYYTCKECKLQYQRDYRKYRKDILGVDEVKIDNRKNFGPEDFKQAAEILSRTGKKKDAYEYMGVSLVTFNRYIAKGKFDQYLKPEQIEYLKNRVEGKRLNKNLFGYEDESE